MAHTPGPWWVQVVENIGVGIFGTRGTLGEPVAQVYSPFEDVLQANATLIAAAPEMLKACGSAVWLLNNRHNKDAAQWEQYAKAAEEDLQAAIAKARGEGPAQRG